MVYYTQTSLVGLLILGIVYSEVRKSKVDLKLNHFLFRAVILTTAVLLLNEMILNLMNGLDFSNSRFWFTSTILIFYILNPIPPALWVLFAEKWIDRNAKFDKVTLFFIFAPYTLHVILSISSIYNGWMFRISESGIYLRGPLYVYMAALMIGYLLYASIRIITSRKSLSKNEFYSLVLFPLPSIIGGLIQMLFFGVAILWLAVSIAILIVFIKLQNVDMYMDHLTGLWNRRKLHQFLDDLSADYYTNHVMAGIMIDVNDFKNINDQHGHLVGDAVLADVARILKSTFNKDDFVCRYGGDEFVAILDLRTKDDLGSCITRLKNNIEKYNLISPHPFKVSLSIGSGILDSLSQAQSDLFLAKLDKRMYESKQSKHSDF
jgi:diguanylate cyclase (GGDEF)-like protein